MNTAAAGNYQKNMTYDLADNFSWSLAKHSLKFGVEYRLPRTSGTGANQSYPTVNLGNASAASTPSPFATTGTFGSASDPVEFLPNFLNAAPVGGTATRTNATNLLYYLNGSVASVAQNYWITGATNIANGVWDDQSTQGDRDNNEWRRIQWGKVCALIHAKRQTNKSRSGRRLPRSSRAGPRSRAGSDPSDRGCRP